MRTTELDEKNYWRLKKQLLELCKDDIVRSFDEVFLERWKKYMAENRSRLMAEAFLPSLIASWILWYIFQEKVSNDFLQFFIIAILSCASINYAFTIGHHKDWVHDEFIHFDTEEAKEKCLLSCEKTMMARAITKEEADLIALFFRMAAKDADIGSSMHSVWLSNSKKTH